MHITIITIVVNISTNDINALEQCAMHSKAKYWLQFRISQHDANGWESNLKLHGNVLQQSWNSTVVSERKCSIKTPSHSQLKSKHADWLIWVVVWHPTWHKIGHFGHVSPSQSVGLVWKKLNLTQQNHTFTNQKKWTTTHNKHKKTKARFSRLLRHPGNGVGLFSQEKISKGGN